MAKSQVLPFFSLLEDPNFHYEQASQGLLGRLYIKFHSRYQHNRWMHRAGEVAFTFGIFTPALLCVGALPFAGALMAMPGVIALISGIKQYNRFKHYQGYCAFAHQSQSWLPPQDRHPLFKTRDLTFNQVFSFKLDSDNRIWIAKRESRLALPNWKPLYLEHYDASEVISVDIKADGKNFMAMVKTQEMPQKLYYKEVMLTNRTNKNLHVLDISALPASENRWFQLPIISLLMPKTWNRLLSMPHKSTKWFMSNAGAIRGVVKDAKGQEHPVWNCTTVFVQDGNRIKICDPFVHEGSEMEFSLPAGLTVLDIEASSSRVVILGERLKYTGQEYCLLERLVSYDDLDLNPFIRSSYDINAAHSRVFPLDKWKEITLPKGFLSGRINIIQTGKENSAQISLEAVNDNKQGMYFKKLREKHWSFYATNHIPEVEADQWMPTPRTCALNANNIELFGKRIESIKCSHFDEHMLDSTLRLKFDKGPKITLNLIRKGSLISGFLRGGFVSTWQISLDSKYQNIENKHWFGGITHDLKMIQSGDNVIFQFGHQSLTMQKSLRTQNTLTFAHRELFLPQPKISRQQSPRSSMGVKL